MLQHAFCLDFVPRTWPFFVQHTLFHGEKDDFKAVTTFHDMSLSKIRTIRQCEAFMLLSRLHSRSCHRPGASFLSMRRECIAKGEFLSVCKKYAKLCLQAEPHTIDWSLMWYMNRCSNVVLCCLTVFVFPLL